MKQSLQQSIIIILILFSGLSAANISVQDTISVNTAWNGVDTVKVTGHLWIADGVTLTIDAGTRIEFQGHYQFRVDGTVLANGTESDSIIFTVNDHTGFTDYSSTEGGWAGIRFYGTSSSNDSSKFSYCRIEYGKAVTRYVDNGWDEMGGGIFINNYNKVLISHTVIENCYASLYGGGLRVQSGNPVVKNCLITRNAAGRSGGGILTYSDRVTYYNTVITQNSSPSMGSGFYSNGTFSRFYNCTIADNISTGAGVTNPDIYGYPLVMRNCIIWNDNAESDYESYSTSSKVSYSLIKGAVENSYGNIGGNPEFSGTGAHPYSLNYNSPAIDAGSTAGITLSTDMADNPRVDIDKIDMGAYEYVQPAVPILLDMEDQQIGAGNALSVTVIARGNPLPLFSFLSSPSAMTIDDSTGVITWTPGYSDAGVYEVGVIAENSNGRDTVCFNVAVYGSLTFISPLPPVSFTEDDSLKNLLSDWSECVIVPGGTIEDIFWQITGTDNMTAEIRGDTLVLTSSADWFVEDTLQVVISNATFPKVAAYYDTTELYVSVESVNDAPVIIVNVDTVVIASDSTLELGGFYNFDDQEDLQENLTVSAYTEVENFHFSYGEAVGDITLTVSDNWGGDATVYVTVEDTEGAVSEDSLVIRVTSVTGIEEEGGLIPRRYVLDQNYPNPFNPVTNIRFGLPEAGKVKITVYNVLGQKVAVLVDRNMTAGYHTVTFEASRFSSGLYFYRFEVSGKSIIKKMLLVQ